MKSIALIVLASLALSLTGCTENVRAKHWGGNLKIEAPAGKQVVNMTWKEGDLWIQYRDRPADVKPAVTTFTEHSSFGLLQGSVTVVEK